MSISKDYANAMSDNFLSSAGFKVSSFIASTLNDTRRLSLSLPPAAAAVDSTNSTERVRQGIVFDKFPFRLDISVEYQDWILVGMSTVCLILWFLPCLCGALKSKRNACITDPFTKCVYMHLNTFFWWITYVNLALMLFTIGVLPDWTVNEYLISLLHFISWVLSNLVKIIQCLAILAGFFIFWKFQERVRKAAGLDHVTIFHVSMRDFLPCPCGHRKRPIEVFIWKVEGVQSSAKVYKANDIFVEAHFGDNEPMRTRVHNNAGSDCVLKESFQINLNESDHSTQFTIVVKDQALVASSELARMQLTTKEVVGLENETGKRNNDFAYSEGYFKRVELSPTGFIWIAVAPVDDMPDEERKPLMTDDSLSITC